MSRCLMAFWLGCLVAWWRSGQDVWLTICPIPLCRVWKRLKQAGQTPESIFQAATYHGILAMGLPQDTKPLKSCSGNRAKMLLKSHLRIKCHSQYIKVIRLRQHSRRFWWTFGVNGKLKYTHTPISWTCLFQFPINPLICRKWLQKCYPKDDNNNNRIWLSNSTKEG